MEDKSWESYFIIQTVTAARERDNFFLIESKSNHHLADLISSLNKSLSGCAELKGAVNDPQKKSRL